MLFASMKGHFTTNAISKLKYGFLAVPSLNWFFLVNKVLKYPIKK